MKNLLTKWNIYKEDRVLLLSLIISFVFLIASFGINFLAGTYATERASLPVTDIILSNIRVFDVDMIFIYGPLIFWLFVSMILFYNPKKIPFTIKSIAIFVIIRSIFITLTHIGPFPTQAIIEGGNVFNKFTFGGDLFFSGHTGLPFLMALLFWKNKTLRNIFFIASLFFGIVVLMGHLHYSIDVLSAFFITYSIFHISEYIFKKDKEVFVS